METWVLRYRHSQRGKEEVHIRASSEVMAEAVGRKYVAGLEGQAPNESYRYIGVLPFCVADESILAVPEVPDEVAPAPKNPTMGERMKAALKA